ncbi:zinc finger CCCH domain-containing protein 11A isoform X2 [Nelusetta ayraudi]|uniref:zinc finger CCCH domain-containing protein 11A isoform X2 n=1 Tax=Nelusetta ayraudi TaxID=303726 RepID=UPI003F6ECB53
MGNHGDDCYFFYYSTCTKGDSCPFRHCPAALGNEIVCNLWQEGHCFRTACKFRHMEITKNRKEIPCYWESQSAGCQKPHCAFMHEKARTIEGIFFPAGKSQSLKAEQPHEEQAAAAPPLPAAAAAAAAAAAVASSVSPQLRSVIKPEAMEPVPSPTHPPVVINAADDDEDEDEEGETGPSPRKITRSDDSMNFGVSTLEEIRLRKALKASMKRAGYPPHTADDVPHRQNGPLRRGLADRLGKAVCEEQPLVPQPASKPLKDRLGLFTGSAVNAVKAEIDADSRKAPEQIRIKTLEEIRKEKAAKSLSKQQPASARGSGDGKPGKELRQIIAATHPAGKIRSTRGAPCSAARKQQQEEEEEEAAAAVVVKRTVPPEPSPLAAAPHQGGILVKTLEEIRREKVARTEAQPGREAERRKSSEGHSCSGKTPRLPLARKAASHCSSGSAEKSSKVSVKSPSVQAAAPMTSVANGVKVKTFEEIMQEKRLRQLEERARGSPEAGPQKDPAQDESKRKVPDGGSPSPPPSTAQTPPPSTTQTSSTTTKLPVRKLISLRSKAALGRNGDTATTTTTGVSARGGAAAAAAPAASSSLPTNQSSALQQQQTDRDAPLQAKRARTLPPGGAADVPAPRDNQEKLSSPVKVRPKLNVKPSVVKPKAHVKPGQKRKAAERSAVAAVKPLNSAATGREEPLQTSRTTTCRSRQAFPSSSAKDGPGSAAPRQPSAPLLLSSDSSSVGVSKGEEELQTVPTFPAAPDTRSAAREACALSQSPQLTSSQPRSRRMSSQAAPNTASSAVDDFDKLIMEFTDDDLLDDGVDHDVNEDDLLQELSEMIEIDG